MVVKVSIPLASGEVLHILHEIVGRIPSTAALHGPVDLPAPRQQQLRLQRLRLAQRRRPVAVWLVVSHLVVFWQQLLVDPPAQASALEALKLPVSTAETTGAALSDCAWHSTDDLSLSGHSAATLSTGASSCL